MDPTLVRLEVGRALAARGPHTHPAPPCQEPPAELVPETVVDLALLAGGHLIGGGLGELVVGFTTPLLGILRVGGHLRGGAGVTSDPLGDVLLFSLSGELGLRLGHLTPGLMIEAGVRALGGWTYAEGRPIAGASGFTLNSPRVEVGLDAIIRARLVDSTFLFVRLEVGAGLIGIDVRADDRRVLAMIGPSVGVAVGLSWETARTHQ